MRTLTKNLLLFALLFVAVLTASAQSRQRLGLTVTPASQYSTVDQCNHYSNTLTLSQPQASQNRLLANVLREGNNYFVFHRSDNQSNSDYEFARINLQTAFAYELGSVDFSQGTTLSSPWSGSVTTYSGGAYMTTDTIRFTIPAGVTNSRITVAVTTSTSDDAKGNFLIKGKNYRAYPNVTNYFVLDGTYSTGDVISLPACDNRNELANYSCDMITSGKAIVVYAGVKTSANSSPIVLDPYVQTKTSQGWASTVTDLNDITINSITAEVPLSNLSVVDSFTASTANNDHPESYDYNVSYYIGEEMAEAGDPNLTVSTNAVTIQDGATTGTFTVRGANLVGDVHLACSDANFSVSPATISAANAMSGNQTVTVTSNVVSGHNTTTGNVTLTTPGAKANVLSTYTPADGHANGDLLSGISFASGAVSSSGYYNLPSPWGNTSSGFYISTSGYAYIRSGNYTLNYTVPDGYSNETLILAIQTYNSSSGAGYVKINGSSVIQLTQGKVNYITISGCSTGNQITIKGSTSSGSNSRSPYITLVAMLYGEL